MIILRNKSHVEKSKSLHGNNYDRSQELKKGEVNLDMDNSLKRPS